MSKPLRSLKIYQVEIFAEPDELLIALSIPDAIAQINADSNDIRAVRCLGELTIEPKQYLEQERAIDSQILNHPDFVERILSGRVMQSGENSFVEVRKAEYETIEAVFQRQTIDRGFQGQEVRTFLVPSPYKDVLMKAGAIVNNPDSIAQYNPVWTASGDGLHRSQRYRVKIQDSFKNLGSCVVLGAEAIVE